MKTIKYFAFVTALLPALASCVRTEPEQLLPAAAGMRPLEIVPVISAQTRGTQITAENLSSLTVHVTGSFCAPDGTIIPNPVLALTKSPSGWHYTYNGGLTGPLYWPLQGTTATFSAHTTSDGVLVNERNGEHDVLGGWAEKTFSGPDPGAVSLTLSHAVSRVVFKARLQESADPDCRLKIDIQQVSLRKVGYRANYQKPTAEATTGRLPLSNGYSTRDITLDNPNANDFIVADNTVTDIGALFMIPQTVYVQDLSADSWDKSYLSVLAQIHVEDPESGETEIFPNVGPVSEDYAWIALPLPESFTEMLPNHSYVFTINFSAGALGKVDRDQRPDGGETGEGVDNGDKGLPIEIEGISSQQVTVSVTNE